MRHECARWYRRGRDFFGKYISRLGKSKRFSVLFISYALRCRETGSSGGARHDICRAWRCSAQWNSIVRECSPWARGFWALCWKNRISYAQPDWKNDQIKLGYYNTYFISHWNLGIYFDKCALTCRFCAIYTTHLDVKPNGWAFNPFIRTRLRWKPFLQLLQI